jgi:hypothetical protein
LTVAHARHTLGAVRLLAVVPARLALVAIGLLATAAATAYLTCPAQLLLTNSGLTLTLSRHVGLGLAVCACALAGLGFLAASRRVRLLAGALSLLVLASALEVVCFRIEALGEGLHLQTTFTRTRLAWNRVTRVRVDGRVLLVVDADGRQWGMSLGRLSAGQRAALERTLARRVVAGDPAVR